MADKLTFSGNKTAKFYPACQAAYLHAIAVRIFKCGRIFCFRLRQYPSINRTIPTPHTSHFLKIVFFA